MPDIAEAKILIIATNGFEDSELMGPLNMLKRRGAEVTLASLSLEEIEGDKGARIAPDGEDVRRSRQAGRRRLTTRQTPDKESAMSKLSADERNELDKGDFAFPKERKEPLENASHVRNAIARFNQVKGVSDEERDAAWKRIKAAAKKHGVEVNETSWREIGNK
jgi:putative intracellular protease/amidase